MLGFASARLLVPSLSLLCLLALAPVSYAQDVPKPTPAVQKLAGQARLADAAGKHEEALRLYNEALMQARQNKDAVGEGWILEHIGFAYYNTGQPQKALEFYQQALPIARAASDKRTEAQSLFQIGYIYNNLRQPQKALEFYQQALPIARATGDKPAEADLLFRIGNIYSVLGQPQKELEFYNQALPLYRQIGNKQSEAYTLLNIGHIYNNLRQPQKALEVYQQALPIARAAGDKPAEADLLFRIGNIYSVLGQPQKALEFYNQALSLARAAGDKRAEADSLFQIGYNYYTLNQNQKALEFYNQALPLYRQIGNKLTEANLLFSIGYIYIISGHPQKGLEALEQVALVCRQIEDKSAAANMLLSIAGSYSSTGLPQKASEILQQALLLFQQLGDEGKEADTLTEIGCVYRDTGQLEKSLVFLEQARSLRKHVGAAGAEANSLADIGNVYRMMGQPPKALEFYEQAQALYKQAGDTNGEGWALGNLGAIYASVGQLQKALECREQARRLFHARGDKSAEAQILADLGGYYGANQPQKAFEVMQQALDLCRQNGDKHEEAYILLAFGLTCANIGQPQKATEYLQQALLLRQQLGDKSKEADTLLAIAESEEAHAHLSQARLHYQQAVALLEQQRANVSSQNDARTAFLASRLYVYYRYLNLLRQNGDVEEAFALTQKTKARSLLDLLVSSRVDLNAALTPEERKELNRLNQQAESLNRQMLKEGVENEVGAKKRFAALQEQLKQNESQMQLLKDRLYALHPGLADQQQARTATVADVAPLLPSDTALLEYVQTSGRELLLFVVTTQMGKPQVRLYPIALDNARFQQQCSDFHAACSDPSKDPTALSLALSRLILAPAQKELQGKTRLIVCPDGPLWDVPFAALSVSGTEADRPGKDVYLWQHYELSYAYSATGMQATLTRKPTEPAEHASVLVLANPDFGSSSRFGDLDDVPGQRPLELPSRPFELPSRPVELPSRPFELPSRPLEPPSRPLEIPSRPLELPSRPFERPSRPLEMPSRQLTATLARGKTIKSLPGAQQEAQAIHTLFPDAAVYTGKAAQEHVVTQEAGKYKYLHFATHGFFNDAAPLLSCIVLAQPEQPMRKEVKTNRAGENKAAILSNSAGDTEDTPTDVEDGLLTARKVFGLHLNADLVTLSACNSGRGQVRTGDGIVGLTWAFFAAGCPSQVVSQWSVDDAATGQLMAEFYKGLKAGKSKSAALRSAALKLSKDGKHQHPYYWTPFFLMGDWR